MKRFEDRRMGLRFFEVILKKKRVRKERKDSGM